MKDDITFSHFGPIFALLTAPKKTIFFEKIKKAWRYYQFTHVYQKSLSVPEIRCVKDERTEKAT